MLEALKRKVLDANLALQKKGLTRLNWGTVSEIDRETGLVVIKPDGVAYEDLTVKDMMVVDLMGNVVDGVLHLPAETATHVELYRAFDEIGGIVNVRSTFATSFAQAGRDIPFYGTSHADSFYGDVPCVRALTQDEVETEYDTNLAYAIIDSIDDCDPMEVPAVLVKSHGAFTFGDDADEAVKTAVELEEIAKMAYLTEMLNPDVQRADGYLLDKHFFRKNNKKGY